VKGFKEDEGSKPRPNSLASPTSSSAHISIFSILNLAISLIPSTLHNLCKTLVRLVAKEQERVYLEALEKCEKEMNSLRSRIHNQREHIKALERKIKRLNNTINSIKGQFGARVIDIVKSAERNWILKGLKAHKDLKLIKEKLRKM